MSKYLEVEDWRVVERVFDPEHHMASESIFSIGNGHFGQRANFEETYEGQSLQGSYVAGVYYPDKTRVGWWKNGYPEYFAKVLNSCNWIGLRISLNDELLDLSTWKVESFERVLDMKAGLLSRSFIATSPNGQKVEVKASRFCSIADVETAAIRYSIQAKGKLSVTSYLDANVVNEDSNYDETFWEQLSAQVNDEVGTVVSATKKTQFQVGVSMCNRFLHNAAELNAETNSETGYVEQSVEIELNGEDHFLLEKFVGVTNSTNHSDMSMTSEMAAKRARDAGYASMLDDHEFAWARIWEAGDIEIEGDLEAQQAIRFNIFHLNQTYSGHDARLNIGPKGFTGEKYGGSTYWDTEAYCLPFYLFTNGADVAKQLLIYRYNQLDRAIENAEKLGFIGGAALYPMVTMNGEECHNEWEITFEEIHRNGAIAYAIWNYVNATEDSDYLREYGFEVLLGIARFWAQRSTFSVPKDMFVILGVTGPNEYENNVNNNWYTNYIAAWCMRYAHEAYQWMAATDAENLERIKEKTFLEESEVEDWAERADNMFLPSIEGTNIFLQQDGFLDKEILTAEDLNPAERPINQHWSWDRILRSVFIKQADVLQGLYFFENHFDKEILKENFDYYEPMTVHESSLSPCVHSVLAAKLGYEEKAYEMYMRTSRLDLDDYNKEVHEGLHITSMAGTWISVVEGFGGWNLKNGVPEITSMIPEKWKSFSFKLVYQERQLSININKEGARAVLLSGDPLNMIIDGEEVTLTMDREITEQG
jgi:maltose phosphorylase